MSAIVHFEIFCDEEERACKFYAELFGWKLERIPGTNTGISPLRRVQRVA
jgi:predicted enzyme related to lactoylglutathione lyase